MLTVFSDTLTEPPKIFSPASIFSTPINQCSFFDGSLVYDESLCSHFSISRLYHANHAEAVRRASECAEKAEVECVLSTEIGLGFPTAFFFEDGSMRAVVAPQLLDRDVQNVSLRLYDPDSRRYSSTAMNDFSREIRAEFLGESSRHPITEIFNGSAAYCIQLLRRAYTPRCWSSLE